MGDRSRKRDRKNRGKPARMGYFEQTAMVSSEKQKARNLRNSSWWKRKISEGRCHYCGGTFPPSELTMDHKIPLSRGGMSDKINCVPSCKECNNKKKNFLPTEWDEYLKRIQNT